MSDQPVKILLIEDTPDDAEPMLKALRGSKQPVFDVDWVDRLALGVAKLAGPAPYQIVVTDLNLPDAHGLDTVNTVHAKAKHLPIVVLTSDDDGTVATQALRAGALDYLVKGYVHVYPDLLIRAIRYAIERQEMRRREQELSDALTAAAVADRTRAAELDQANQELKQTQAMLVQAEKMAAVGQLASGIAHEVKNPLHIILQCVNYLEPEVKARGAQAVEILEAIREAVMTADKIVRGLLDFSKPAPLELKAVQLGEVIDAALLLINNQAATKKVLIAKSVAPDLPPVVLDAQQIKQVLLNLFLNAIQAMPGGGELRIRARAERLTAAGRGVGGRDNDAFRVGDRALVCEIEDTGTGIPKELLPRVFNPFFTTKAPGEGVGLGLSITSAIIQAHRGLIQLDSEAGKGTTVTILLPISE